MRTHSTKRGFTLVELLVAMTVTLIVVAAATVTVVSQEKAYAGGLKLRQAQAAARRALLAIEQTLPSAGFGLDAALAFDFEWYQGPCPAAFGGSCPRDSTSGPDELVFYARDPRYYVAQNPADDPVGNSWRITAVTANSVTLLARAGDRFKMGQIIQAVCTGAAAYTYFTLGANYPSTAGAVVGSDGAITISLMAVSTSNPFRRQDVAVSGATNQVAACFTATTSPPQTPARAYLVNRYRYHVRPAPVGTQGSATVYDPLLVLDRGVDTNGDGTIDENDEELVAEGIESMQVAYGFNAESGLDLAGLAAGTAIAFPVALPGAAGVAADTVTMTSFPGGTPALPQTYALSSFYPYTFGPPSAAERRTNHQGNIQVVRVAILARSITADLRSYTQPGQSLPVLNQSTLPAWVTDYANALGGHDGYQRVALDTSVGLPNMSTRAITYF